MTLHYFFDLINLKRKKKKDMPQFSPLWFINLLSWAFAILSFMLWFTHSILFPNMLRLLLARKVLLVE